MAYIALARKYRPQSFKDLLSQEFITETLQNAVKLERVSHAYLFTGPRGVGKTSAARIYAKMLNCTNLNRETLEPCGECDNCKEITQGSSLDVLEIDGASNRGVQEVRELRENVKFVPLKSKYKIVIIDEVHMLTEEAFNALLKTLEEPPEFVIFIFATTDLHKIPATILSRCQRYEFQKISFDDMLLNLTNILNVEKVHFENEALRYIIRASDGCMRDALSLLDQVIAYNNGNVQEATTAQLLGEVNNNIVMKLFKALIEKSTTSAPNIIEELDKKGTDYKYLTESLIEYCRNMLIYLVRGNLTDRTISSTEEAFYAELKDKADISSVKEIFERLVKLLNELKYSSFQRYLFEFAAFDIIAREEFNSLAQHKENIPPTANHLQNGFVQHNMAPQNVVQFSQVNNSYPPASENNFMPQTPFQPNFQPNISIWQRALEIVGKRDAIFANHMRFATVIREDEREIHLLFPKGRDFQCKLVADRSKNMNILRAVREVTGMPTELYAQVEANANPPYEKREGLTPQAYEPNFNMPLKNEKKDEEKKEPKRSQAVDDMLNIFGGKIDS